MTSPLRPLAVAIPLALTACSPPSIQIDVQQGGDGRTLAHLSQDWGVLLPRREAPCIREVELHSMDAPHGKPLWQARRTGDDTQCTHLPSITLGTPPPGFAQTGPLPTSLRGSYRLIVRGIGFGDTIVTLTPRTGETTN